MPIVSDNEIMVTFKTLNNTNEERYRIEGGTTIHEFLAEEKGINPANHSVLLNGTECQDLDRELNDGDYITLIQKKYTSGI